MIYGDISVIGVQLELVVIYDTVKCGMFNFVMDEQLVPGKGMTMEFYPTLGELRGGLIHGLEKKMPDIGQVPIEQLDFSEGEPQSFISISASEVYQFGFTCWLGFDGDEDRFLYTTDYEKTIQEKRYPRGTIEKLIRSLPSTDQIEFCSKEAIKIIKHDFSFHSANKEESEMPTMKGSGGGYLDEVANEWLEGYQGEEPDKFKWDVMLSPKWRKTFGWPSKYLAVVKTPLEIKADPAALGRHIDFYSEVEIVVGKRVTGEWQKKEGRKGVVLGISEKDGIVYGYSVYFRDDKADELITFNTDDVRPTGFYYKREEFYDGSYACVSPKGKLLDLHVAGVHNQHENNSEVKTRGSELADDTSLT